MLEQYLGAEAFRDGIRLYLRRHAYDNAETTDLWDALEESTKEPVRALMDSWIFQAGYPLISLEKAPRGLHLSQQMFRYLQDGSVPERRWHVPIFLRAATDAGVVEKTILLTENEQTLDLGGPVQWAVVNAGAHGFYRARYDGELLAALKGALSTRLSPVERFSLINDAWASTLAGLSSLSDYLDLIGLVSDENDLNVWTTVIGSGYHLERILDDRQSTELKSRMRVLLGPAAARFGWKRREGESDLESQLRGDLINALGVLGDEPGCQSRARELFALYETSPDQVERNLIPALVSIFAQTSTAAEYDKFYRRFQNAETPQEETRFLFALASFRAPELIEKTLELTINGEVRTQNSPYLMRGILLNKVARERAWAFLKAHWDEMSRQYPDNAIPRMCEGIVGLVSSELEADVKEFFARHPVKQGTKQMEQHLERLRVAVACRTRWRDLLRT
jgi:puromycin-sensitive aminopeptidase